MSGSKLNKLTYSVVYQLFCISLGLLIIFPILYAIALSFMEPREILTRGIKLLPNALQFGNYRTALRLTHLGRYMLNSLVISLGSSVVRVIVASLAAFGFSFFNFKGKRFLFMLCMTTMLIPGDAVLISNYKTVATWGLIDTYLGMMIIFFVNVLNIFMFRQHFLSISKELYEAGRVDGCSNFRIFVQIMVPVSKPIIATVFMSSFVQIWNTYLWPMLVTNSDMLRTVQVGVTMLNSADGGTIYGPIMAASTMVVIPTILVFVIFQKQIVSGVVAGAIKG